MEEIRMESTRLTIKNFDITIQHQEGSNKVTLLTNSPETIKAFRELEQKAPDLLTILEYPEDDAEGPVHMIFDQTKVMLKAEESEDGAVRLTLLQKERTDDDAQQEPNKEATNADETAARAEACMD